MQNSEFLEMLDELLEDHIQKKWIIKLDGELKFDVHLTPKISDHSIISIQIGVKKIEPIKKLVRNYRNINELEFQLDLMNEDWLPDCTNTDILADTLINTLTTTLNKHAPSVEINLEGKWRNKKWWNLEIGQAMKERDILYKRATITNYEIDWQHFRQQKKLSSNINKSTETTILCRKNRRIKR